MRRGVAALQQSAAHNQTAAMMEIGSSLLNQTAAQTRKLTDVEAQVSGAGTGVHRDGARGHESQVDSGGRPGAGQGGRWELRTGQGGGNDTHPQG